MILVTGGAGFIGGNFVLDWLVDPKSEGIINLDKLTYAGNLATLDSLKDDPRHTFVHGDIGDKELVARLLKEHQPRAIVNFAARVTWIAQFMGLLNLFQPILWAPLISLSVLASIGMV